MDKRDQEFQKKLLATFKVEAAEHVQILSSGLIELEQARDQRRDEVIETIFREAHSLKGAARAVGVTPIESICQGLESAFSAAKRKQIDFSAALFDVLHDAVDSLGRLLLAVGKEGSRTEKSSTADLLRRLDRALKAGVASSAQTASAPDRAQLPPKQEDPPPGEPVTLADTVRVSTAKLDALLFQTEGLLGAKLMSVQRAAEIRETSSALSELNKERARMAVHAKTLHQRSKKPSTPNGADAQVHKLLEFILWQSERAKSLEARLIALADGAERDHRSLAAMVDELLQDMKQALMLPIASILEALPKFVRDLSRTQGKAVELIVRGGEIEIDRRILDAMRDPLIHLVRNCMDHGIETAEVRQRNGKPSRGTMTIAATQKDGSRIEIVVADDGAGIDIARVEQAAQKLGVGSRSDAQQPDDNARLALVFQSGVSTSPIITDMSGRGLGLAIVREKVEKLGGAIDVETQPGRGTTFRILLPLTLATLRGVHVRVNGHRFVVPTSRIEQVVRLKRDLIKTVENRETIQWNGHAVALVHLVDVLELPRRPDPAPDSNLQAIVLGSADQRIAFAVDEILDEQEVLMKPLGKQLSRVRNVAGAAVLGTGKAVPILDVPDLLRSAVKVAAAPIRAATGKRETEAQKASILVAEDSITSRTLLKNILESAGYAVATAVDGADAFASLKTQRYDLIVSDVEMPRMSGFDLTAKIRADRALAELPVVLVTALGSREDRERGIDVGANAYIVKSSFDQSNLLDVIRRLI